MRSLAWIETANLSVGADLLVSLPEMDLSGNSCVTAIEPCPPLAPGEGRIVLATVTHLHNQQLEERRRGRLLVLRMAIKVGFDSSIRTAPWRGARR